MKGSLWVYLGFALLTGFMVLMGIYLPITAMLADPNLGNWTYSSEWALEGVMVFVALGLMFLLVYVPLRVYVEDLRREEK